MGRAQKHSVQQFKRISLDSNRHRMLIGERNECVYVTHQIRQIDSPLVG